jgi:predicted transcriptional regulator
MNRNPTGRSVAKGAARLQSRGQTMSTDYAADIRKYTSKVDDKAVSAIVKFCGIALGLDAKAAEAAVKAVGEKMKADKTKHRVTVYYLVAEQTGTLAKLA